MVEELWVIRTLIEELCSSMTNKNFDIGIMTQELIPRNLITTMKNNFDGELWAIRTMFDGNYGRQDLWPIGTMTNKNYDKFRPVNDG